MQYRNGVFTSTTPVAITIPLGFAPDHVIVYFAGTDVTTAATLVKAEWFKSMANASAFLTTSAMTTGALTVAYTATNGITPYSTGGVWLPTTANVTGISKANPAVVTCTNTFSNGDTITLSNAEGMIQVNEQRYIVTNNNGTTFTIYDLFGNPVNSLGYGTFVNNASNPCQANQISTVGTAAVVNSATGQIITPAQPPGNQYDTGSAGFIIGTSAQAATKPYFWEAFLMTPTGW